MVRTVAKDTAAGTGGLGGRLPDERNESTGTGIPGQESKSTVTVSETGSA